MKLGVLLAVHVIIVVYCVVVHVLRPTRALVSQLLLLLLIMQQQLLVVVVVVFVMQLTRQQVRDACLLLLLTTVRCFFFLLLLLLHVVSGCCMAAGGFDNDALFFVMVVWGAAGEPQRCSCEDSMADDQDHNGESGRPAWRRHQSNNVETPMMQGFSGVVEARRR